MNFKEYQDKAKTTAVYPRPLVDFTDYSMDCLTEDIDNSLSIIPIMYCALGLSGEAGEVAEQVKKSWRNDIKITEERKNNISNEIGDVLWYCAQLATELDLELESIVYDNIFKLQNRKQSGDLKHE